MVRLFRFSGIFFLGIYTICIPRLSAQNYPSYEVVVGKFYDTYWVDDYTNRGSAVKFEKKKDGWHVVHYNAGSSDESIIWEQVFWSAKTASWEKLNAKPKQEGIETKARDAIRRKHYLFDVSPYYGYKGWYNDVIEVFGPSPQLDDTLLYALAKAYYEKAAGLMGNQYGHAENSDIKRKSFPPNSVDKTTEQDYIRYGFKSIEIYKRLEKQNPDFKTKVGNMDVQISNEYMSNWLNLYIWQNKVAADTFMLPGLYDSFMRSVAYNYLQSCPPMPFYLRTETAILIRFYMSRKS